MLFDPCKSFDTDEYYMTLLRRILRKPVFNGTPCIKRTLAWVPRVSNTGLTVSQIILSFRLVPTYALSEDRSIDDVNITNVFPLIFFLSFENFLIFHVTGKRIRQRKVLWRLWTGTKSRKKKEKDISFSLDSKKILDRFQLATARLNQTQNWFQNYFEVRIYCFA